MPEVKKRGAPRKYPEIYEEEEMKSNERQSKHVKSIEKSVAVATLGEIIKEKVRDKIEEAMKFDRRFDQTGTIEAIRRTMDKADKDVLIMYEEHLDENENKRHKVRAEMSSAFRQWKITNRIVSSVQDDETFQSSVKGKSAKTLNAERIALIYRIKNIDFYMATSPAINTDIVCEDTALMALQQIAGERTRASYRLSGQTSQELDNEKEEYPIAVRVAEDVATAPIMNQNCNLDDWDM
jgi:hypothetical protein